MNLAVVHLTDFHVKSPSDPLLDRGKVLAAATTSRTMGVDAILIAVTGDLSFSGLESELLEAFEFVGDLRHALLDATNAKVSVAVIPGNHDCDFTVSRELRRLLRPAINDEEPIAAETLALMVKPLTSFFEVRDAYFPPAPGGTNLAWHHDLEFTGTSVRVTCFNTAWCSSHSEIQGRLFFPANHLPTHHSSPPDLAITLLHHPATWMESQNGRKLTLHLEETADIVFTGHDHVPDQRWVKKLNGQSTQYVEGIALQTASGDGTGFNLITINTTTKRQRLWTFHWDEKSKTYSPAMRNPPETDLQVNRARKKRVFAFTDTFQAFLDDLGLDVIHPEAGRLSRRQVFEYPHLRRIRLRDRQSDQPFGSEHIVSEVAERIVLITGDEGSGKTSLSKQIVEDLLRSDVVPVYIRGRDIRRQNFRSNERLDSMIAEAIEKQYGPSKAESYYQLDRDQRALVIDDFDQTRLVDRVIDDVQQYLTSFFGRLYLFADAMSQELKSIEDRRRRLLENRSDAVHFGLQPFGYQRRENMVQRWMMLDARFASDVDELVIQSEFRNRILDSVIGKNLVPAYPVYILGVLQASEHAGSVDLRASANAHYYELFIKNAMALTSDNIEYSIKTSFLAFLAYSMLEDGEARVSEGRFRDLYCQFKEEYALTTRYDEIVQMLTKSRLLIATDGRLEFKYAYCFYYFSALYLTNNLEQPEVRRRIACLADEIYEERNANIFLFLAHLSGNTFVLDEMLRCAEGMFADAPLATLSDDLHFLGENAEALLGPGFWDVGDVRELRRMAIAQRDKRCAGESRVIVDGEVEEEYAAIQRHSSRLGGAFKTLEIMGQVLKNFPASIRASRKRQIARAAYGVALRALGDILSLLERNQTAIVVDFMEHHLESGEAVGNTEAFERARASVAGLARLVGFGAVRRIVSSLGGPGSESPSPVIREVAGELNSPISDLTVFGMELDYARAFPRRSLDHVYDDLKGNGVASDILRYLVVRHMHLFPVSYKEKEKACAKLGIRYKDVRIRSGDPRRKLVGSGDTHRSE